MVNIQRMLIIVVITVIIIHTEVLRLVHDHYCPEQHSWFWQQVFWFLIHWDSVLFRRHVFKVSSDDLLCLLRLFSWTTGASHKSIMYFHKVEFIFLLTWKNKRSSIALLGEMCLGRLRGDRRQASKPLLHLDYRQIGFCVICWAGSLA